MRQTEVSWKNSDPKSPRAPDRIKLTPAYRCRRSILAFHWSIVHLLIGIALTRRNRFASSTRNDTQTEKLAGGKSGSLIINSYCLACHIECPVCVMSVLCFFLFFFLVFLFVPAELITIDNQVSPLCRVTCVFVSKQNWNCTLQQIPTSTELGHFTSIIFCKNSIGLRDSVNFKTKVYIFTSTKIWRSIKTKGWAHVSKLAY